MQLKLTKIQTKGDVTSCASKASFASAVSAAQNNQEISITVPWLQLSAARRKSLIQQLMMNNNE